MKSKMSNTTEHHHASQTRTETLIFAAGCFWGVQYHMDKFAGVLSTEVGYIGGKTTHPTYESISKGNTGHVEAVKVTYDTNNTNLTALIQLFFEIHDPTQTDGQGPDKGTQYLSRIYYQSHSQKKIIDTLMIHLIEKGYNLITEVSPLQTFWIAELEHQNYYDKNGQLPYCHIKKKRF